MRFLTSVFIIIRLCNTADIRAEHSSLPTFLPHVTLIGLEPLHCRPLAHATTVFRKIQK
jgi:hypothetical protein